MSRIDCYRMNSWRNPGRVSGEVPKGTSGGISVRIRTPERILKSIPKKIAEKNLCRRNIWRNSKFLKEAENFWKRSLNELREEPVKELHEESNKAVVEKDGEFRKDFMEKSQKIIFKKSQKRMPRGIKEKSQKKRFLVKSLMKLLEKSQEKKNSEGIPWGIWEGMSEGAPDGVSEQNPGANLKFSRNKSIWDCWRCFLSILRIYQGAL